MCAQILKYMLLGREKNANFEETEEHYCWKLVEETTSDKCEIGHCIAYFLRSNLFTVLGK